MLIRKAGVIGAGTMGSGIATHLANAGVEVVLLDIVPPDLEDAERSDPAARSRFAAGAMAKAAKSKPAALFTREVAARVRTGNVEDHLDWLADCDWVVEAVTENLAIKRDLYEKINSVRRDDAIVSSNTSGLALSLLTEGFDESFRQHFLVTHFFNPPRYMYLLEIVPGPETKPAVRAAIEEFSTVFLGKGVVECKDTPNFIANRIGVFSMGISCRLLEEEGLTIEEVDAITGPPMGRPRTATFRLHDLVGIDVALMVMQNARELLPRDESRDQFVPTEFLQRLVAEKKLGRKTGEGFYKKVGRDILVLDLETFEYREPRAVEFESLAAAKKAGDVGARLKALVGGSDKAANYAWRLLSETLCYTARRIPEIADDVVSIDRALRWGFSWELGPFEVWDAIGVPESVARLEKEGREVPALVEKLLASGAKSFYGTAGEGAATRRTFFDFASAAPTAVPERPGVLQLDSVRRGGEPLRSSAGASVWDLGDGVLGVEFHSKMNSLSGDMLQTISEAVDLAEAGDYVGVVVGNQAANFSVGANIKSLAAAAVEKDFDAIDAMIRAFHGTVLRMRYSSKPVVVATQGMALGGGCEVAMAGCATQAAAETYMGLVELGVGLIPAGGGTREMACRAAEAVRPGVKAGLFPHLAAAFETIAQAKTSTSASEAQQLGFLRATDSISMNRDRTLADAKRTVLYLAAQGYRPPPRRVSVAVAGRTGLAEFQVALRQYQVGGFASDYDVHLGKKLAYVLCGGDIDAQSVGEEYLLDLERQVFLSLCGEEKTLQRIEHTLKTGKPLRN